MKKIFLPIYCGVLLGLSAGSHADIKSALKEKQFSASKMYFNQFSDESIPICGCRIFELDGLQETSAKAILGDQSFALLTDIVGDKLLPIWRNDWQEILNLEISYRESEAENKERLKNEFPDREVFSRTAKRYRSLAEYTKTIKPTFYPYLIKAKVFSVATGNFLVSLKGTQLEVYHGSLGKASAREAYIIVLSERKIDSVEVNAGQAL